jgi:hypothetical protein
MDIVIPLGRNKIRNHWELRYLLRSLSKNFLELEKVWVIGDLPDWATNIIHIPFEDSLPNNKDGNIINKIISICSKPDLSEHFLRCSDDQLLLKPLISSQYGNYYDLSPFPVPPVNKWYKRLVVTKMYCQKNNHMKSHNFDCHIPTIVHKNHFLNFMTDKPYEKGLGMTINTLYFNQYYSKTLGVIPSYPLMPSIRANITYTIQDADKIKSLLENNLVCCYSDYGMTKEFINQVQIMFPEKSKFEL